MEIQHIETPSNIATNYMDYLYLRRKRLFEINGEDDEKYGEGEQDSFALVYSPDRLETQYPLGQFNINLPRWAKPCTHDYKSEYFSVKELESNIDPMKSTPANRIYVKRYESAEKVSKSIENPIDDFLTALKIFILNDMQEL